MRDLDSGINEVQRCFQHGSYLVKDENGNLLSDFHILNKWKN
jgi:hypothetical protein